MEEWKEYKLKDICIKITDGSHSSPRGVDDGYPMFSVKDMQEYGFDYSKCKYVSYDDFLSLKHNDCVPQKGDVLVAKDGSYLKQIFVCKETRDEGILSSIAIFRPNTIVDSFFLCYLLKSPEVYNYIANNCVSGSALPRIVLKDFKEVKLRVPSLTKQKEIVSILKSLDDKIEVNRKINENLEQQAQALFKSWFVDFEPFKDGEFIESELGMIPKGWRVCRADEVFEINIGKTPPRKESEWFTESKEDNVWVSIADMGSSGVFISDSSEYLTDEAIKRFNVLMVEKDSVLLSFKLTVGRVAIADTRLTTNEAIARFILPDKCYREFLYLYLKQYKYENLGSTSSIATAVNSKTIKGMKLIVPPTDIIESFSNNTRPLFEQIRSLQQESRRLAELRDTLLPKLMSGEIKVNEIEK